MRVPLLPLRSHETEGHGYLQRNSISKVNTHDWYRKKVQVWGRYYADMGYIVVGDIQMMDEGEQKDGKSNSSSGAAK